MKWNACRIVFQIRKMSGNGEHWKSHVNASTEYTNVSVLHQLPFWLECKMTWWQMLKWISGTYHMEGFAVNFIPLCLSYIIVALCAVLWWFIHITWLPAINADSDCVKCVVVFFEKKNHVDIIWQLFLSCLFLEHTEEMILAWSSSNHIVTTLIVSDWYCGNATVV